MSKINETNYPRRTQASYEDTDMLVIQESGGNTYTTRIEDLREDCQETLAPALNTMRENLATVEGSTASKAYAKGDFLVFGGRLCKAKTSIASGATLVLDTNIELDSVGDELSSISSDLTAEQFSFTLVNSITSPDVRINSGIYIPATRQVILQLSVRSSTASIPSKSNPIATIPKQYAPTGQKYLGFCMCGATDSTTRAESIYLYNNGTTASLMMHNFLYAVDCQWLDLRASYILP